ncbi:hypothetical protein, partial [Terribacillus sp. AE2B 122]
VKNRISYWNKIQDLASTYNEGDETTFNVIYRDFKGYLWKCAINAEKRALAFQLAIPIEEFYSSFTFCLWRTLNDYQDFDGDFKPLILYRLKLAEASVWKHYEVKGGKTDKDNRTYEKARWLSINSPSNNDEFDKTILDSIGEIPSAEEKYLEVYTIQDIFKRFAEQNRNQAKIIISLYKGYYGKDLSWYLFKKPYSSVVRKRVERAKENFRAFLAHNL